MATLIKNIILYEPAGAVAGFVEIRPGKGKTALRLKQSLSEAGLMLSLVVDGVNKVLKINGAVCEYIIDGEIDLEYEVFACIVKQVGAEVVSVASGAINLNKLKRNSAVKEIDAAIKKICSIGEDGRGRCDDCPYREYFFN